VESKPPTSSSTKENTLQKGLLDKPVIYLIDPPTAWKTQPWDIDLLGILQEFRDRITLTDQVNLSLAGRAVSVASHLHRKRAEAVVREEKKRTLKKKRKQRKPPKEQIDELALPQTFHLMSRRVSTIELLNALARAVQIVKRRATKSTAARQRRFDISEENLLALLPEELVHELDLGSESIEQFIRKVYTTILREVEGSSDVSVGFFSLVQRLLAEEMEISSLAYKKARDRLVRLYIVRVVLCVLYLILRNKIAVNQTEFFADLQIRLLPSFIPEEP